MWYTCPGHRLSLNVVKGCKAPREQFDDVRLAAFANPPLTTIAQPKYEMGVVAVTMLLERMRDLDGPAYRQIFETCLVTRKSTGPERER